MINQNIHSVLPLDSEDHNVHTLKRAKHNVHTLKNADNALMPKRTITWLSNAYH